MGCQGGASFPGASISPDQGDACTTGTGRLPQAHTASRRPCRPGGPSGTLVFRMRHLPSAPIVSLEAKRRRPPLREGLVSRRRLIRPLLGSADLPLALLVAPAGYGKTTVLSQWAEQDTRPFAWVTLEESENDAGRLLAAITSVLDKIEPVEAGAAMAPDALLRAIEGRERSFVLVLDD